MRRYFINVMAALLSAFLCSSVIAQAQLEVTAGTLAQAEADTPGDNRAGTLKVVDGDVTMIRGSSRSAAVVGGPVWEGDRLVTGHGSAVALVLRDGSMVSLGPDSSVELARFDFEPTTQDGNMLLALARGSLRVVTGLIAKLRPEQVQVTTPTTVIGVRGTDFIVEQAS